MNRKRIILVIDDSFLDVYALTLLDKWYRLIVANDDVSAIKAAQELYPDLIMMDWESKRIKPLQTLSHLRSLSGVSSIPILFLLRPDTKDDEFRPTCDNDDICISKPIETERLLKHINHFFNQRERESGPVYSSLDDTSLISIADHIPEPSSYDISFQHLPARTGGDGIIDFMAVNPHLFLFLFGDVIGKGNKTKFLAHSFTGYLHGLTYPMILSERNFTPASLMSRLSKLMDIDPFLQDVFLTLLVIRLDTETHEITYTNAGYMPTFYFSAQTGTVSELGVGGGVPAFSNTPYEQQTLQLSVGDAVIVVSDGILEARDRNRSILGIDTVKECIQRNAAVESKQLNDELVCLFRTHIDTKTPANDGTISVMKRIA
jgi:sigma-B regulation protein RsbU (phosphoserine phosphatase)